MCTLADTAVVWGHVLYVLSGVPRWLSSLAWFKITVSGSFYLLTTYTTHATLLKLNTLDSFI